MFVFCHRLRGIHFEQITSTVLFHWFSHLFLLYCISIFFVSHINDDDDDNKFIDLLLYNLMFHTTSFSFPAQTSATVQTAARNSPGRRPNYSFTNLDQLLAQRPPGKMATVNLFAISVFCLIPPPTSVRSTYLNVFVWIFTAPYDRRGYECRDEVQYA